MRATARLQSIQSMRRVGFGDSDCIQMVARHHFMLLTHFRRDLTDKQYLLIRVNHVGEKHQDQESGAVSLSIQYSSTFQRIPREVPFRPREITPKPTAVGVQTAVVVGKAGEEIYTDKYGFLRRRLLVSSKLKFYITLPRGKVMKGDQIILNMMLENLGEDRCYVNTRFAVAPVAGDVRLCVKRSGQGGDQELPFQLRVRLPQLKNSDFLLLGPGEQVVAGYRLLRGFRLDQPGTYEVQADYVSGKVPPELEGLSVFTGKLSSTPRSVTIA